MLAVRKTPVYTRQAGTGRGAAGADAPVKGDGAGPREPAPMEDQARRMRLLAWHATCFAIHTIAAVFIANVGAGNDMRVDIVRLKSSWENAAGGYGFEVVPQDGVHIRIDTITWLFFAFSAAMHGIWVTFGLDYENSKRLLWDNIDGAFCWW